MLLKVIEIDQMPGPISSKTEVWDSVASQVCLQADPGTTYKETVCWWFV
jgi:hypothetical protein